MSEVDCRDNDWSELVESLKARIAELEAVVAKITVIVDDHAEFDDAMQDIHAILGKLEEE